MTKSRKDNTSEIETAIEYVGNITTYMENFNRAGGHKDFDKAMVDDEKKSILHIIEQDKEHFLLLTKNMDSPFLKHTTRENIQNVLYNFHQVFNNHEARKEIVKDLCVLNHPVALFERAVKHLKHTEKLVGMFKHPKPQIRRGICLLANFLLIATSDERFVKAFKSQIHDAKKELDAIVSNPKSEHRALASKLKEIVFDAERRQLPIHKLTTQENMNIDKYVLQKIAELTFDPKEKDVLSDSYIHGKTQSLPQLGSKEDYKAALNDGFKINTSLRK